MSYTISCSPFWYGAHGRTDAQPELKDLATQANTPTRPLPPLLPPPLVETMAQRRQQDTQVRTQRAAAAAETVHILKDDDDLRLARERTSLHRPDGDLSSNLAAKRDVFQTVYELWPGVPTLEAALRLSAESAAGEESNVAALVFASAKNPGGGYLKGSMAQEESLAVASGLALCQQGQSMYGINKKNNRQAVYNDMGLYSPKVGWIVFLVVPILCDASPEQSPHACMCLPSS